jgi:hypothetical protein
MRQYKQCPVATLQKHLTYDRDSGRIKWAVPTARSVKVGDLAGTLDCEGYRKISIFGVYYMAHRVAWAIHHGEWPSMLIDHRNGNKDDNSLANLRDVPDLLNQQNRRSAQKSNACGLLGVQAHKTGRFQAKISAGGRRLHLGYFDTAEQAHAAYMAAKAVLHEGYVA